LPISDVGPGIPEKAIGIGLVILAEIQQYQKKKKKRKEKSDIAEKRYRGLRFV
jgi:hypothetical protein